MRIDPRASLARAVLTMLTTVSIALQAEPASSAALTSNHPLANPPSTAANATPIREPDAPETTPRFKESTHSDGFVEIEGVLESELTRTETPPPPRSIYEYADCDDHEVVVGAVPTACALSVEQQREALDCTEEQTATSPWFVRSRPVGSSEADWSPWEWTGTIACVEPEQPSPEQILRTLERDLASLAIPPSPVRIQPDQDWTYVNLDTIVMTDADPITLTTTVLGVAVDVRVTPTSYRWDFGDGTEPLTTTDPGKPYPDHTLAHIYATTGEFPITLTTTWTGEFRTPGNAWQAIPGSTTTTSSHEPLTLVERRSRLTARP